MSELPKIFKTTKEVETALHRTDVALKAVGAKEKIDVVLFGGASVILNHRGNRWTFDVDVHVPREMDSSGIGTVFYDNGIQIVPRSAMLVHPDYQDRLKDYKKYDQITVKLLSPVDIAISKVARGHENDFYDLFNSDMATNFTLKEFRQLYEEAAFGKKYPDGSKYEGWKKDKGTIEHNLKRAEGIIIRRKLLSENNTLFEERFRDLIGDMAESTGHVVTCTKEDFSLFPPRIPKEFQVLSFLMLSKQERTTLERWAIRDKTHAKYFYEELMPSVRHFYDNIGCGLSDTPDTLTMSNALKGYLKFTGWSLGAEKRAKIKDAIPSEGIRTIKMFQTLAGLFLRDFNPDKRKEIDTVFSKGPAQS